MLKHIEKTVIVLAVLVLCFFRVAAAQTDIAEKTREAEKAFVEVIAAWGEERFEALYDRASPISKDLISKQEFVRLMRKSNIRLQCCWITVQAMKGVPVSETDVYVTATLGYELFSSIRKTAEESPLGRWVATTTFKEDTFFLYYDEGQWGVDLSDILSAGGYIFAYPPLPSGPEHSLTSNKR